MLTPKQIKILRIWRGLSLNDCVRLGNYAYSRQTLWNLESGISYLSKSKCLEIIRAIETAFSKKYNNMVEIERIEDKVQKLLEVV